MRVGAEVREDQNRFDESRAKQPSGETPQLWLHYRKFVNAPMVDGREPTRVLLVSINILNRSRW